MSNSKTEDLFEITVDIEADVPTVRYNNEAYRAKIRRQAYAELESDTLPIIQRAIPIK